MEEREPIPIKEWDILAEKLEGGVHWLEQNQTPTEQQGVFIKVSIKNYWFYPVRRVPDQDSALDDAKLFHKYLTDKEGLLKELGYETRNGLFRWLDQKLTWYENPDLEELLPSIKEWDRVAEKLGEGAHWLEKEKSPAGLQGVFLKVSNKNYWFYPVRRTPDQDRALEDATTFYNYLTDKAGLLRELRLETRDGLLRWFDEILTWYENPDARPMP